jgi:diacylglycerol kinase (ATP)
VNRKIGVLAHQGKTMGGGLDELRTKLADQGFTDPAWVQVPKSKKAPAALKELVDEGIDTLFVWGGDGTVQRCIDALVTSGANESVDVAIVPAGTANLLANNLGVPTGDVGAAVGVGLNGERRTVDIGCVNGEHFAVMAGVGFDAVMIEAADHSLKDRIGRMAYIWTGARAMSSSSYQMVVKVDGKVWFAGRAGCVLCANVGTLIGGVTAIPDAVPDDGSLDIAVITAGSPVQWTRVLARMATGHGPDSPLVQTTTARRVSIRLEEPVRYELDGGARKKVKKIKVTTVTSAITFRVPVLTS